MGLEKSEAVVRDIRRRTQRKYYAEEKITIVLEGLRSEESISAICRRRWIAPNLYYRWSNNSSTSTITTPTITMPSATCLQLCHQYIPYL